MYKQHEHHDCDKLLVLTRFLHFCGFDARAAKIQERDLPDNMILPTILLTTGQKLTGYDAILQYLQEYSGVNHVEMQAEKFHTSHPKYTIQKYGSLHWASHEYHGIQGKKTYAVLDMSDKAFVESVAGDMFRIFKYDHKNRIAGLDYVSSCPHLLNGELTKFKQKIKDNMQHAPLGFQSRVIHATKFV